MNELSLPPNSEQPQNEDQQKVKLAQFMEDFRAAQAELSPEYVEVLRHLRPGVRIGQAFALWRMARDALYRQELDKGLRPEDAMRAAAARMVGLES